MPMSSSAPTLKDRLQPFIQVTLAALLNMGIYLALNVVLRALANDLDSLFAVQILLATVTTGGFAVCLLFFTYLRRGVGEDKLFADYRDKAYTGMRADLRVFLRRERGVLITLVCVIGARALLISFDHLVFGQVTLSHVTFPYLTMVFFETLFPVSFLGDLCSAALIGLFYIPLCLLTRRRAWRRWAEESRRRKDVQS